MESQPLDGFCQFYFRFADRSDGETSVAALPDASCTKVVTHLESESQRCRPGKHVKPFRHLHEERETPVTVTIPAELETAVQRKAEQRQIPVENVVREALEWYLGMDTELFDELAAWQEVRDEAIDVVEGTAS